MPKGDKYQLKADPEDGTTPVANLLLEAVATAKLSGKEKGAILYLWRRTYGWTDKTTGNRLKERVIPLNEWLHVLQTDESNAAKIISGLVKKNIFLRQFLGPGKSYIYQMNTNVASWDTGCINQQALLELTTLVITDKGGRKIQPTPVKNYHPPLVEKHQPSSLKSDRLNKDINKDIKESVPHTPKLSRNPFIAKMQSHLGFPNRVAIDPVPNPGKEAKFIKKMLGRGFSEDRIFECWRDKVDERREFVSMQWVNEDIGKRQVKTADSGRHGDADSGPLMRYGGRQVVVRRLYLKEKEELGKDPVGFTDRMRVKTDEELLEMYNAVRGEGQ